MKSLIRLGTTIGLVGAVLLGSLFTGATRALALTQEQVMTSLQTVPVFALMNQQGGILLATPTQGDNKTPVAGIFIDGQDAQNFLNKLKQNNPQASEGAQVVPISLAKVYQLSQEKKDQVQFIFIPSEQQVQAAQAVLQQSGQQNAEFQGVPLFAARSSDPDGAYLTIQQGNRQIVPMFFNRQELQALLDRLKQAQPELAAKMSVQVINLEGFISTLQSSNNNDLTQIQLDPADSSIEFTRAFQQANPNFGQAANQQQPQGQQRAQQRPSQPNSQSNSQSNPQRAQQLAPAQPRQ
ncbi:MAG TPA: Tic22 family protein [Coleofasciculaceae cyanobacterium]